jgi:hypothetical protein
VCGGDDGLELDHVVHSLEGVTVSGVQSLKTCETPLALAHVTHSVIRDVLALSAALRRQKFGY